MKTEKKSVGKCKKVGKRRLPYYTNPPYIEMLIELAKSELGLTINELSKGLRKDYSLIGRQCVHLVRGKMVRKEKKRYRITYRGKACLMLAVQHAKCIVRLKEIHCMYEVTMKAGGHSLQIYPVQKERRNEKKKTT